MKLVFGDEKSILARDNAFEKCTIDELLPKIKCRFCGAKANHCFEFDRENKAIGWNFDCKKDCPNSVEWALENTFDGAEVYTDLKGKNI